MFNLLSLLKIKVPLLPPPMPPGFLRPNDGPPSDNEAMASMLMSWYMSGYHTGYYQVSFFLHTLALIFVSRSTISLTNNHQFTYTFSVRMLCKLCMFITFVSNLACTGFNRCKEETKQVAVICFFF